MAEIDKLSVEKALKKIRADEVAKPKSTRRDDEIGALDDEIRRMREQRHRLERRQRKPD